MCCHVISSVEAMPYNNYYHQLLMFQNLVYLFRHIFSGLLEDNIQLNNIALKIKILKCIVYKKFAIYFNIKLYSIFFLSNVLPFSLDTFHLKMENLTLTSTMSSFLS